MTTSQTQRTERNRMPPATKTKPANQRTKAPTTGDPKQAVAAIIQSNGKTDAEGYEEMFRQYMAGKRASQQHVTRYGVSKEVGREIRARVRGEMGGKRKVARKATSKNKAAKMTAKQPREAMDTNADKTLMAEAVAALLRERDTAVAEAAIAYDNAKRSYREAAELAKRTNG